MKKLVLLVIWCACSRNPTEAEALDAFAARSADLARFEKQIVASYTSGQIVSKPKACKERTKASGWAEAYAADRACIRAYQEDIARVATVNAALEAELVKLAHETHALGFQVRWHAEGVNEQRVGDGIRTGPMNGTIRWGVSGNAGRSGVVSPRDGVPATGGYKVGWGRYDDERGFTARRAIPYDAGEILVEVSFPITRSE